jgi:hypothetical protein
LASFVAFSLEQAGCRSHPLNKDCFGISVALLQFLRMVFAIQSILRVVILGACWLIGTAFSSFGRAAPQQRRHE